MRLESGPAGGDRNYALIVVIICLGLGGYFAYDWLFGYPGENRHQAIAQLGALLELDEHAAAELVDGLPDRPLKSDYDQLIAAQPRLPQQVRDMLGQPLHTDRRPTGEEYQYYAGKYGEVIVLIRGGTVLPKQIEWRAWFKGPGEIKMQLYCALFCGAVLLLFAWKLYRAVSLRVIIDDEGMTYAGRLIRFEDMVSLRDYSPKGWIDLYHRVGAREKRLRLDNQKVRKFDEIVEELCNEKGFDNPVKEHAERLAREDQADDKDEDANSSAEPGEKPSQPDQ